MQLWLPRLECLLPALDLILNCNPESGVCFFHASLHPSGSQPKASVSSQGTFGNAWRHFLVVMTGVMGTIGIFCLESGDPAKHLIKHRAVPHHEA